MPLEYPFGNEILKSISEQIGVQSLKRVIIDIEYGRFPQMYIQLNASKQLLTIDWANLYNEAKVTVVDQESNHANENSPV